MSLPDLIEIVPLEKPVRAEITVPGSKSITNRALILAALAGGKTTLRGALWSEDTQVMVASLQKLGFDIRSENDPEETSNRIITVRGLGGKIPNAGTMEQPLELFVGNAGTVARFLSALVCLGHGVYRLSGVPRMHERPQAALFSALRELGHRVESENGNEKLPATIFGRGRGAGQTQTEKSEFSKDQPTSSATVSIAQSSQFASALLLGAEAGGWEVKVVGENAEESPYVAMTSALIKVFPKNGGTFLVEPDASSGSYFWGAGWLLAYFELRDAMKEIALHPEMAMTFQQREKSQVMVSRWPDSGWQLDADFTIFLRAEKASHPLIISRSHDLADSIMTAIVLAPFSPRTIRFTDLGRLRVQECERVVALRTELTKCGAKVIESGDTLEVSGVILHGAEIDTYHDHRMAMCFAVLGLKVPGIKIKNPACVKKTFPNFFQKLAAAPPQGLGATILDAQTRQKLSHEELFAH